MKATQQTIQQIQRAIRKVAAKFPKDADPVLTDIHMQVKPESAELLTYNDEMEELDRAVIEQWLEPTEEDLYTFLLPLLVKQVQTKQAPIPQAICFSNDT